jgi:flagellar biosynthesis protein FlhA
MQRPGTRSRRGRHVDAHAAEVALKQEEIGVPACLLVPDQIRSAIARLVRRVAPRLQVLAHSEIPETHTIRIGPILRGAAS